MQVEKQCKLELEEICDIAHKVFVSVVTELGIESRCIEPDPDSLYGGTRDTEYGNKLYWAIEDTIKASVKFDNDF
jgi:hypothetical protein